MASALPIRLASGSTKPAPTSATTSDNPAVPVNVQTLVERVEQLTNTVNALVQQLNTHTHSGVTVGAGTTGAISTPYDGTAKTAQNLFTPF